MKITKILHKSQIIIILTIICTQLCQAQFTVTATATDEECPGTGTLALSVQNANPSYEVNYKVYLLPETNIPFYNSSNSFVEGLQDGEYLIVASQSIDGNLVTAQTEATIGSNYVPLAFSISSENAVCGNDGSMVINVTSGNPVTYEIIGGPATAPAQASNIFNGLPAGTYEVRVTDNCGNGFVSTQTFYVEQSELTIAGPVFSGGALASCDQIYIGCTISALNSEMGIVYPLTVQMKVYPPSGGAPVVHTQQVTSGPENGLEVTQAINYYDGPYTVDFIVTDICGTSYTLTGNAVQEQMSVSAGPQPVLCNETVLTVSPQNYMPPYTINFTSAPAGFNPSQANPAYPGPFTESSVVFGTETSPAPLGSYEFTLTDACGRTTTKQVIVNEPLMPEPTVTGTNNDCVTFLGSIRAEVANHPLQTAVITSAPASYQQPVPADVTAYISNGVLTVPGLPIGSYTLTLTDICGNTYENVEAVVPEYTPTPPQFVPRADCVAGKGALLILSNLTSVIITQAPAGFEHSLPYNASGNIADGVFSMDGFAGGTYTIKATSSCSGEYETTVEIPGLEVTNDEIALGGDCVSFSLDINYASNADALVTFWLQAYNDDENIWMHPETGVAYEEGEVLNEENAVQLEIGTLNESLPYLGEFRVMKMQRSYGNASEGLTQKHCIEEVYDFYFYNELDIRGIYNLTCVGELIDVQVDAIGVSPLRFELISKDGDNTFYVDNGENNVFTGLQSGLYRVRVTDPCGGFRVQQFNITELPPLVNTSQPEDLGVCDTNGTGEATFDLTVQTNIITNNLDDEIATVTYHTSLADAENGSNAISDPDNYTSGTKEIFARVEWVMNPECYGIATFNLLVTQPGEMYMEDKWAYCEGSTVTVTADPGYESYLWSTGETTQSIEVGETGTYTVTAISTTGCEIVNEIEVVQIMPVEIEYVEIDDFNGDDNSVTIITTALQDPQFYEYSIDGLNYQESNVFTGVPAGNYTAIVRDRSNCGEGDSKDFHLLDYPKYFTPNGDGVNDKWRIEYAILEPGMVVDIYDRYGKPITSISATSEGWDGTLNGSHLPSTDYWFVVKREDGREIRGHFAMMR